MSGEDIAVIREDIRNIEFKINDNCQKIAVIEERLNNNDKDRKDRQHEFDNRMTKIEGGIDILIARNQEVDGWYKLTKKTAVLIVSIATAGAAIWAFLKFLIGVI